MTTLTEELVEAVTLGGSPLRACAVDVSAVPTHVLGRHQLLEPPRRVRAVLEKDLTRAFPTIVWGDEAKLERLLLDNLVSNALKFSPDDGVARVAVTGDARTVEVRVADDGPGVPAEQLTEIFSPFRRAPAPAATSVPGVGLG